MILAVDVDYQEHSARAAGVVFENWNDQVATEELTVEINKIEDYMPGEFYKRELPCILAVLERLKHPVDCIVVDGYVSLGEEQRAGLGMHLWHALGEAIPVVGVAKTAFHGTPDECRVIRGDSARPLFVTAVGLPLESAKRYVGQMHGPNRIPVLLKRVDQVCRGRV